MPKLCNCQKSKSNNDKWRFKVGSYENLKLLLYNFPNHEISLFFDQFG
jgi:hypothetical protein